MYSITGERRLTEWEIDWLPGYEGAKPVRIGNGAHGQIQIDVYGEVMDALYQAQRGGLASSANAWALQKAFLDHLEQIWALPDRGIWESRRPPRHFTFSKVMAWVAFDRGVKIAQEFKIDGPIERWSAIAETIHEEVCANGFDTELNSFVQSYGSKWLDGSLLLIPTTGFLPADDPRIVGTVSHDPAEVGAARQPTRTSRRERRLHRGQGRSRGDISEILLDTSGKVTGVIIGVGGFLGLGQHDVLVRMEQLNFVNEPRTSTTTTPTTAPPSTTTPSTTARSANEKWYSTMRL